MKERLKGLNSTNLKSVLELFQSVSLSRVVLETLRPETVTASKNQRISFPKIRKADSVVFSRASAFVALIGFNIAPAPTP